MNSIEDFYTSLTIGQHFVDYLQIRGFERFKKWLPEDYENIWARVLSKFVLNPPLSYWNDEIVDKALIFLETNPQRTYDAITHKKNEIDNGIDNLLRTSRRHFFEESLDLVRATDILLLANEIHPEYLLIVEHIFGNLIDLYWAVIKRKSIYGGFDLPAAVETLIKFGGELLVGGYDDKVRNAIAHGQVFFKGVDIQYGDQRYKYELPPFEFFDRYDLLWRTCVSITIALILFLARNQKNEYRLPLSIARLIASASTERIDFQISDYMISELPGNGPQLHVLIETTNLSRNAIIKDCVHFAIKLYRLNETSFSRLLFDVTYPKKTISGLFILDYQKLIELVESNASLERTNEIIISNLLWYDEKMKDLIRRNIFRNLKSSAAYGYRNAYIQNEQYLPILPIDSYRIKQVKKVSAGGIPIIEIRAVLFDPPDVSNRIRIRRICRDIIRKYRFSFVATNPSKLGKHINLILPPRNIRVYLYKHDGTIRWLGMNGWSNGELVCISEYSLFGNKYFVIKKPDLIEKNVRYQFSMNSKGKILH